MRASGLLDDSVGTVGALTAPRNGYDGRGIGVAIIDSGVASEQRDLNNRACASFRVVYSKDFVTWELNSRDPYGHGTHVAGIAGGNGICAAKMQSPS